MAASSSTPAQSTESYNGLNLLNPEEAKDLCTTQKQIKNVLEVRLSNELNQLLSSFYLKIDFKENLENSTGKLIFHGNTSNFELLQKISNKLKDDKLTSIYFPKTELELEFNEKNIEVAFKFSKSFIESVSEKYSQHTDPKIRAFLDPILPTAAKQPIILSNFYEHGQEDRRNRYYLFTPNFDGKAGDKAKAEIVNAFKAELESIINSDSEDKQNSIQQKADEFKETDKYKFLQQGQGIRTRFLKSFAYCFFNVKTSSEQAIDQLIEEAKLQLNA